MKFIDLKMAVNKPYFNRQDLALKNLKIFNYQLALWRKKGYIERLKRDLYVFSEERDKITAREASFLMYEPSYISLESAMSHYGFIPEIVHSVTAVTPRTTRKFSNNFGHFIYRHIKPNLFFGYFPVETENGKYLLAEPEKAIIDYFYLNLNRIKDAEGIEELRLNRAELKKSVKKNKLNEYAREYKTERLNKLINIIQKKC